MPHFSSTSALLAGRSIKHQRAALGQWSAQKRAHFSSKWSKLKGQSEEAEGMSAVVRGQAPEKFETHSSWSSSLASSPFSSLRGRKERHEFCRKPERSRQSGYSPTLFCRAWAGKTVRINRNELTLLERSRCWTKEIVVSAGS